MAKNMLVMQGTAMWAKVFEPDTKFNPQGDYSINLQMPVADSVKMSEQLESLVQVKFNEAVEKDPRLKNTLTTQPVCQPVYDRDTGDDTEMLSLNLNLKQKCKRKMALIMNNNQPLLMQKEHQ